MIFGVAAAWVIARFRFPGRTVLTALIADGLTTSAIAKRLADAGHGERRHLYVRVGDRRTGRAEPE